MPGEEERENSKKSVPSKDSKQNKTKLVEKTNKDPNIPKRPPTAYRLFWKDHKEKLEKSNPDKKGPAFTKLLNDKYKALPKKEKDKYVKEAKKLKDQYNLDMKK